ncbi:MAG: polyprenyl synthetase family protein [Clostridiales bacterium]|nr:polyprenyl synthetase family protein [Clostridiales bacterium]
MKNRLNELTKQIDAALDFYLPAADNDQKIIYEAMRYSVFAGGKRLRPILMLECAKMCGGSVEEVMPFACAMEMIHTYSLIHDDLPAMDNDDLRRGMPTSHKKFGEANAILAGDALLTRAFEVAASAKTDPAVTVRAISMLAASAGTEGMIGGQILDIQSEGKKIKLAELKNIHLLKTGAIIRSACTIGAIAAGMNEAYIKTLDDFGTNLGIAFQIRDDILDVEGETAALGKTVGSDASLEKNTYVRLLGLERSKDLVEEYSDRAKAALAKFKKKADFLTELTDYLINRIN